MSARHTRRRLVGPVGLAAVLVVGLAACTTPARQARAQRLFIIGVRGGQSVDAVADERQRSGIAVPWRGRNALPGFTASLSEDEARSLAGDSRVEFVEADFEVTTQAQATPTGVSRIGASTNAGLRINSTADGAVDADVAIVDSGIDLGHADLNVGAGVTCIGGSCRAGGQDDNGHGTHVAGTIGAKDDGEGVVGVAPGARVVPVKVLSSSGSGSMSQIVAGLDWVAANSARIDVVNMSLGGVGTSSALNNAVQNLVNRGVTVVVAAGNSNRDARVIAPANATDVITVSALADYNGRPGGGATATCRNAGADDSTASFSNYGAVVEIAAPGVCINSTRRGGGTTVMSGTSMASPHVAGAAAILASRTRPTNRAGVQALSQTLISAGTTAWTDNKPDGVKERLLDVSNASIFNPVLVGGPSNPVPTTTTTVPGGPVPTTTTTAPPTTRPTLSVAGVSWLGWRSATLTWSGIAGTQVAVYRNGMLVATVANTGSHADLAGFLVARATYRVCAAGSTSACSSDVNVTF